MRFAQIGCTLSHVKCSVAGLRAGYELALVMEDDIHFDYVDRWTTSLREILDAAPADWDVLQLTLNNAKVLRAIVGVGERFVPWQSNHWSTGAYLISRRGMEKIVEQFWRGDPVVFGAKRRARSKRAAERAIARQQQTVASSAEGVLRSVDSRFKQAFSTSFAAGNEANSGGDGGTAVLSLLPT